MKPFQHNRFLLLSWLLCIALLTTTCKQAIYAPGEGDTIQLQADTTIIAPGESVTITITGVKASGHPMPDNTLVRLLADSGKFLDLEGNKISAVRLINGMAKAIYQSDENFTGESVVITAQSGSALVNPEQLVITIAVKVNQPPIAAFEFSPKNPSMGETVYFVSTSSDPDGTISHHWNFGDGSLGSQEVNPTHVFPVTREAKEYQVILTVTDDSGQNSIVAQPVAIALKENKPPVADFVFSPTNPQAGKTVYFNAAASIDPDGEIKSYQWDFGDNTPITTQDTPSTSHLYNPPVTTTYTVTLRVVDDGGAEGVASKEVTVEVEVKEEDNQPPTADFSFTPDNPKVNESIQFLSESTDVDGTIENWEWDFGDNKDSVDENPTHSYQNEGTYLVELTVTDDKGDTGTKVKMITVSVIENQPPEADFTFSPTNPQEGELVRFNAVTSTDPDGTIDEYKWDFGDGGTGTGQKPKHRYKNLVKDTTFTVILTVTDNSDATDSVCKEITVSKK